MDEDIKKFYGTQKWKNVQARVMRRDGYQCQLCKRYGIIKEAQLVHHKLDLLIYPELAYNPNNLISVCKKCHNKLHPEKGGRRKDRNYYDRQKDYYSQR